MIYEKKQSKYQLWLLFLATMIIHMSSYLIIPLLPLFLYNQAGLGIAQVSIVIGANFFAVQIGSLLGGLLFDHIGTRLTISIGTLIQGLFTLFFIFTSSYSLLILISVMAGIGHGISAPSVKAGIKLLTKDSDDHAKVFSRRGIIANVGLFIAGLIILFTANNGYYLAFILSAILLGALTLIIFIFYRNSENKQSTHLKISDYKEVLKDSTLWIFVIVVIIVNLGYAQLPFLLPLRSREVLSNTSLIGIIWTLISLEVILLQSFITKITNKKIHEFITLAIAMIFFALGILLIGFSNSFIMLLISALVFTVGQCLITPTIDTYTGSLAPGCLSGAYYCVSNLATGLGSAAGTYLTGLLFAHYGIISNRWPWFLTSLILFSLALPIILLRKLKIKKDPLGS